nr:putative LPS biosynthesis protein WbpG [Plesiomonas shigelloides]
MTGLDSYQVCSFCVMDTTDPEITFDENGRCNHCVAAEKKLAENWFPNENGEKKLKAIAEEIKRNKGSKEYDSIIGISGGIDSSYLLHLAKVEMNLNPLVVHVDAGWNSEIAVNNIEKMVKKLDLDLFTYVVDWHEMRDLQVAYLKSSLANQDVPQDHAFFAKLYQIADENNISYTITGSNLTSESILPASWGYDASDSIQIKAVFDKFGQGTLKNYPIMSWWKNKIYWPYLRRMKIIRPLNFIDYNKNEAIRFLQINYDWQYYGGKHHESKWTKFFQAHYLPKKFGFDKRKAHLSSMIVAGQITRDEALKELSKPLYNERDLKEDMFFIEKKLNLEEGMLVKLMQLPNKSYMDYPNDRKIIGLFRSMKRIFLRK